MALIVEIVALIASLAVGATAAIRLAPPVATSPWIFPLIISIAICLVSIALVVDEVRQRIRTRGRAKETHSSSLPPSSSTGRIAGWLALSAGYGVITPIIGFEWATAIFLPVALRVFSRASWLVTIVLTACMALLLPLAFRYGFQSLVP